MATRDIVLVSLESGKSQTFKVDTALTGLGGYPIPSNVQIIGGRYVSATPGVQALPQLADFRRYYLNRMTLKDTIRKGRFADKSRPHEISAVLEEGWAFIIGGKPAFPVYFGVMKDPAARSDRRGPFLDVLVLNPGTGPLAARAAFEPRQPNRDPEAIFIPLDFGFAVKRGLVVDSNQVDDRGQPVYSAVADFMFVTKDAFEWGVGPRNIQRSTTEPGPGNLKKELWNRNEVDKLAGAFGPVLAPIANDEEFFVRCLAIWAMGCQQRVRNPGGWGTDGLPNGDNIFLGAHAYRSDLIQRDRNGHPVLGANGKTQLDPAAFANDPIGDVDPTTGVRYPNSSDVTEMVFQAYHLSVDQRRRDPRFEDDPNIHPFRDLQSDWLNWGYRLTDRLIDKRAAEMRRQWTTGMRTVSGWLELGKGNYGMQEMPRIICYLQLANGQWVVDHAITTWEQFQALPPAAQSVRHAVRGASSTALGAPDRAMRDILALTATLTDVLHASDDWLRIFRRDPKPWQELAGLSQLLRDVLPLPVAKDIRDCCEAIENLAKPLDERARRAEGDLVAFAEHGGVEPDVTGHPFASWRNKMGERTPRAIIVLEDDWDRLLRTDCAAAVQIVRTWAFTTSKIYLPENIPADVAKFMGEFREEDAIGNRILNELRQHGYQGRFDELCDWFEEQLQGLTQDVWEFVWSWVRNLRIGRLGVSVRQPSLGQRIWAGLRRQPLSQILPPPPSGDKSFGATIAVIDSPIGYRQVRRVELGPSRPFSLLTRAVFIGLVAYLAGASFAKIYGDVSSMTAVGIGVLTGLQSLLIWGFVEWKIGYALLYRKARLWFIKTMTGEAEISAFTVGTWLAPAIWFLLIPMAVYFRASALNHGVEGPCEDIRRWACEIAARGAIKESIAAFIATVPASLFVTYVYKRILSAARHHMFHSIKEPGAHLDLLFTRHGTPLYGWELEARVFSVCLLVHGITMGLPFLFVLYVAGQMGDMGISRLWSGGW